MEWIRWVPAFSPLEWVAVLILSLLVIKCVHNVANFLFTTYVGSWLGLNVDLQQYGPWAVVTGATDGIGKAYSLKLASLGLNVVLISRSPSKLKATAQEIRDLNPFVQVKTIAVDFTADRSIYKAIAIELDGLNVGVLINNVGISVGFCQHFTELQDEKVLDDVINCNVVSMTRMTHLILPRMLHRQRGVIINIGSLSGAFTAPFATIYAATKAFVDRFSRNLSAELRSTGVVVQTVMPGFVLTNMAVHSVSIKKTSLTVPNAEDYVNANLRTLGLESRTAAYWWHKIFLNVVETGSFFFPGIVEFFTRRFLKERRSCLQR